jgi:putative ABC transport system substrate-binding protein
MDGAWDRLSRREFVVGAGASSAALLTGCGRLPWQVEAPARVPRIGFLGASEPTAEFREGLREFGYLEGQNLSIEYRNTGQAVDSVPELAAELVGLPVDLIVAQATFPVAVAKTVTSKIPIVSLGGGSDLVAAGVVDNLARPGGNVTGLTSAADRLAGKRLQLLAEAIPGMARVAIAVDEDRVTTFQRRFYAEPAQILGVEILFLDVQSAEDIDGVFETAIREHADAVYVVATLLLVRQRTRVVALAARHRLAAMYESGEFITAGGLMVYQGSRRELHRRAAYCVDRILKGAKPADLPIEQPMTFDFVVNIKTAQALGITFPNEIMLQVTEVIQ